MTDNKIVIPTTQERFLKDYLTSLNGMLKLTEKELDCLEAMILINKNFTATAEIRKQLVERLGLKNVPALNNLIKPLKDKGVLREDRNQRRYDYNPMVIPTATYYTVTFQVQ